MPMIRWLALGVFSSNMVDLRWRHSLHRRSPRAWSGPFHGSRSHLDEARLGYFGHLGRALRISAALLKAGAACLLHAFVPALFSSTASDTVRRLHRALEADRLPPAPVRAPMPPGRMAAPAMAELESRSA
jgi:hypothetical protein